MGGGGSHPIHKKLNKRLRKIHTGGRGGGGQENVEFFHIPSVFNLWLLPLPQRKNHFRIGVCEWYIFLFVFLSSSSSLTRHFNLFIWSHLINLTLWLLYVHHTNLACQQHWFFLKMCNFTHYDLSHHFIPHLCLFRHSHSFLISQFSDHHIVEITWDWEDPSHISL